MRYVSLQRSTSSAKHLIILVDGKVLGMAHEYPNPADRPDGCVHRWVLQRVRDAHLICSADTLSTLLTRADRFIEAYDLGHDVDGNFYHLNREFDDA